jgi:argininosuccinate lyase
MQRFSSSLPDDLCMLDEDIDGSIAHATMLGETGVIAREEAQQLCRGLDRVRQEIRSGDYRPGEEHDDIHMAVEFRLHELLGPVAGKLHTARSRNDQVATDVRLWLKRRLVELDAALVDLATTLIDRIESDGRTLIPGYTHLQRGQPILLGHHVLAHVWALLRDRSRFADALARLDRSPLGACAMAGTSHPIDRERTAELLGFAGVVENAMDAVSARDHEQEVAASCAVTMSNLSRMAQELVLWSTSEFDLVRLSDSFATGSSIMPQKRNPDAAELVRAKAARVHGNLVTLLGTVQAQPLAYNRDLQESRKPLFDSVETSLSCLRIMQGMWRTLEIRADRFDAELQGDASLATELADMLVGQGVPFREAHEAVGTLVRWLEEHGRAISTLSRWEARRFHPGLAVDLAPLLDPRAVAERKTSRGGTAWTEVERQLEQLRGMLGGDS